jgi:hypothetical protein
MKTRRQSNLSTPVKKTKRQSSLSTPVKKTKRQSSLSTPGEDAALADCVRQCCILTKTIFVKSGAMKPQEIVIPDYPMALLT